MSQTAGARTAATDFVLSVAAREPGSSFPSDGTANIWVGASDQSGQVERPRAAEVLTVTVKRPDGETDTFERETGSDGNAHVAYDLAAEGRTDGFYQVTVEHPDVTGSASTSFLVGTSLRTTTGIYQPIHVGEEVTYAVLAREGDRPQETVELAMSVVDPDGEMIVNRTTTTDADGFATVSFTPTQSGNYSIEASRTDGNGSTSVAAQARTVIAGGILGLRHAIPEEQSTYGGYLCDAAGMVSSTDFTLRFREETTNEIVLEKDLTTDGNGFYLFDFELPAGVNDDLEIEGELASGEEIGFSVPRIRVSDFSDISGPSDTFVDASTSQYRVAPGSNVNVEIEAISNGTPITNETVDVIFRLSAGPVVHSTSVVTGDDGTATASIPVPETIPDGVSLFGEAVLEYDGDYYSDSIYASVEQYEIDFDAAAVPGEQSEFSIDVTERDTGDPVDGITLAFDAMYSTDATGSFATGTLRSDETGTDTTMVDIPSDVRFQAFAGYNTRYDSSVYRWLEPEFPGGISVTDQNPVPGQEIEIECTVPEGTSPTGIVFGRAASPDLTIGTDVSPPTSTSLTIPEHADWLSLTFWAADEDGNLFSGHEYVSVDNATETHAVLEASSTTAETGKSISFDASQSTAAAGTLSYAWEFGDGTTATGETVQHSYDTAGDYVVTLTVTDDEGTTDSTSTTVEITAPDPEKTIDDYVNDETGTVDSGGLTDAIDDWRSGNIDLGLLQDVIDAWRQGSSST